MPNRHQEALTRYAGDTYADDGTLMTSSLESNGLIEVDPFALGPSPREAVESLTALFPEPKGAERDQGEVILISES